MEKILFIIAFFFASQNSFAQLNAFDSDSSNYVLIIPFEDKMFSAESDLNIELSENNNLSTSLLTTSVKFHVMKEVASSLRNYTDILTFQDYEHKKANDLKMIYSSVYYEYKLPKKARKLRSEFFNQPDKSKIKKPKKIVPAKLLVKVEDVDVFMAISDKYNGELFVFISQVELKKAPGTSQEAIAKNDYFRQATIHYTLIDKKGKPVKSDIAVAYFPSHINEIDHISKEFISKAAKDIAYNIPPSFFSK